MEMKRIFAFLLACIMMFAFLGCSQEKKEEADSQPVSDDGNNENSGENPMPDGMGKETNTMAMPGNENEANVTVSEGKGYPATITDRFKNSITFESKPEKTAVISGTFLGLLYSVGEKSICTTDVSGGAPVPEEAVSGIPVVGKVYNPDIEQIIGLEPDLVIAQFGLQNGLIEPLTQSGIQVLAFHMRTYDDVIDHLRAFGRIVNKEEKAEEIITNMEEEKNSILEKLPEENKKVVVLYATSQDISVKLENSIAGSVIEMLGIENIAAGCVSEEMGGESTPFSMEYIVEKDPDVILVTSMLSDETTAAAVVGEKIGNDTVWKGLRAVKEGNIVYLPQKYFLYNAGEDFVKAIEYVAKAVYPEIYGEIDG